jgi:hypothetical protein
MKQGVSQVRIYLHRARISPDRLVFIDETWTKTNMTRTHGWHRRGEPLNAKLPHGHWKTMTFLAALWHDRITAPFVLDGPINGESFKVYIQQVLAPTIKPGDIVIMDNLGSHKAKIIRRIICAIGAHLLFLLALVAQPVCQISRDAARAVVTQ